MRLFAETGLRVAEAGIDLVREVAATVSAESPALAGRLGAARDAAAAALASFQSDLARWLDTGSDSFALGEDDFDFRLHFEHALRDTAPELWRYGHHLQQEIEADLVARARRLKDGGSWHSVVDRLRADHPTATTLVQGYAREMARARISRPDWPWPTAAQRLPTPALAPPSVPYTTVRPY